MTREDITYSVQLQLPDDLNISSADLSVLFANLVENAIEACRQQIHTERRIAIQGSMHGDNTIAFTFTNTYSVKPQMDSHGTLLSTKHEGTGIGVESVRSIVHKYNGQMDIKAENNIFNVKILLLIE
ncbi:MAG: ATP-binding protein [Atopobiaceae bacterium]|nr:ATP-binding protein [Atopobiaceae bacterium]